MQYSSIILDDLLPNFDPGNYLDELKSATNL
jgi:hypothetical protein